MAELEQSLEDRKSSKVKQGLLMELYSISEEEAYNRIRALSMKKRDSIVNICKALIHQVSK